MHSGGSGYSSHLSVHTANKQRENVRISLGGSSRRWETWVEQMQQVFLGPHTWLIASSFPDQNISGNMSYGQKLWGFFISDLKSWHNQYPRYYRIIFVESK